MTGLWQDIAAAPKDGTYFIAARFVKGCRHVRYGYAMVDRWHDREINPADTYTGLGRFNTAFCPRPTGCPFPRLPKETPHDRSPP